MNKLQIICPSCNSKINFLEGTIIEHCVSCQTQFVNPDSVAVKAIPVPNATIVNVTPIVGNFSSGGN